MMVKQQDECCKTWNRDVQEDCLCRVHLLVWVRESLTKADVHFLTLRFTKYAIIGSWNHRGAQTHVPRGKRGAVGPAIDSHRQGRARRIKLLCLHADSQAVGVGARQRHWLYGVTISTKAAPCVVANPVERAEGHSDTMKSVVGCPPGARIVERNLERVRVVAWAVSPWRIAMTERRLTSLAEPRNVDSASDH